MEIPGPVQRELPGRLEAVLIEARERTARVDCLRLASEIGW
jgi:hypothetical protein